MCEFTHEFKSVLNNAWLYLKGKQKRISHTIIFFELKCLS